MYSPADGGEVRLAVTANRSAYSQKDILMRASRTLATRALSTRQIYFRLLVRLLSGKS